MKNLKIWVISRANAGVMKSSDFVDKSILERRSRFSYTDRLDEKSDVEIYSSARARGAVDYDVVVVAPLMLVTLGRSLRSTVLRMRPGESGIPLTERQSAMVDAAMKIGEEA